MSVQEVRDRDRISNGHEPGDQKTKGLLEEACTTLPPPPWDATTWEAWTSQLKEGTGLKGRALFHPLRLALTGLDRGPEMKYLLPLLGYERVLYRLKNSSNFSKAPEGL